MSKDRNILFCTDFSEHANTAFDHAMDQARKYKATLHIFHAIMPSDPCGYSIVAENRLRITPMVLQKQTKTLPCYLTIQDVNLNILFVNQTYLKPMIRNPLRPC
jgi:hypothetical protein